MSCRKERACECSVKSVYTPSNGGAVITYEYSFKITKQAQKRNQFRNSQKCFSRTETYAIVTPTLVAGNYIDQYICKIK